MSDLRRLAGVLDALRGATVRGARLRDADSLVFDLVTPLAATTVRVYSVAWRIETDATILVGVDDEPENLPHAVQVLDGRTLVRVSVTPPSLDTTFDFSDLRLRVFPVTSQLDPDNWQQWSLRFAGGRLDVGPGSSWRLSRRPAANGPD